MRNTWVFFFLCLAGPLWASDPGLLFDPAEALGSGARPAALGSAFAAVPGGLDSLDFNPAGLTDLTRPMLALHHQSWLDGINRETVAFASPTGAWGVLAGSVQETFYGNYENRDSEGNLTGSYQPHRDVLKMSWARSFFRGFSAALEVENQQIYLSGLDFARLSVGGGLLWRRPSGLAFGASFSGLGTYVGTIPSAQTWRIASWMPLEFSADHPTFWAVGATFQPYGVTRLQTGAEQTVTGFLTLRSGYQISLQDSQVEGFQGFSAGFGMKWNEWTLDYAFLPVGELGTSHRISLKTALGKAAAATLTVLPTVTPVPTVYPTPFPKNPEPLPSPTRLPGSWVQATPTPNPKTLKLYFEIPPESPTSPPGME